MGREAKLSVSDGTTIADARVHLDSETLTVGPPFRVKLKLGEISRCAAGDGGLEVAAGNTRLAIALTAKEAAAWAKAMLNPPSLATKLGLKAGMAVATLGEMPPEIAGALKAATPSAARLGAAIAAQLVIAAVPEGVPVAKLAKLKSALAAKSAVWLIYRKGGAINGDELIFAAREAGLKDTKVAKISETHTGLRFIPGD